MKPELLAAIVDAIKTGVLSADSPLSVREFQAIHDAVAIAKRKWAIDLVTGARQEFKHQVEELAAHIP